MTHPPHTSRFTAWSLGVLLFTQASVAAATLAAAPVPAYAEDACKLSIKLIDNEKRSATVQLDYPRTNGEKTMLATVTDMQSKDGNDPVEVTHTVSTETLSGNPGKKDLKTPAGMTADAQHTFKVVLKDSSGKIVCSPQTDIKFDSAEVGQCKIMGDVVRNTASHTAVVRYQIPGLESIIAFDPLITYRREGTIVKQEIVDEAADTPDPQVLEYTFTDLPEPRVYKLNITLRTFSPFGFNYDLCSTNFEVNMSTDTPPAPPATKYEEGKEGMFTWLTAECINLASEDVPKLEAITCVIDRTIQLALNLVGVVSTALVVLGGFYILSSKNDEGRAKGKKIVAYALTGLVIVLLAYVITQVITAGGIIF